MYTSCLQTHVSAHEKILHQRQPAVQRVTRESVPAVQVFVTTTPTPWASTQPLSHPGNHQRHSAKRAIQCLRTGILGTREREEGCQALTHDAPTYTVPTNSWRQSRPTLPRCRRPDLGQAVLILHVPSTWVCAPGFQRNTCQEASPTIVFIFSSTSSRMIRFPRWRAWISLSGHCVSSGSI